MIGGVAGTGWSQAEDGQVHPQVLADGWMRWEEGWGSSRPSHHVQGALSSRSDIVCTPKWLLLGVRVMARHAALGSWRREVRVGGRRGDPRGGVGVWGQGLGLQAGAPPGTAQRGRGVVYLGLGGLAGRGSQQHAEDQANQSAHTRRQTHLGILQGIMRAATIAGCSMLY